MTPNEVYALARAEAAESSTSFWSEAEMYDYMWLGEIELAMRVPCTKTTDSTTTTVASTREYTLPTGTMVITRATWNYMPLIKINEEDIDELEGTGYGFTGTTGSPTSYYTRGATTLGLSPIPDAAQTLKLWYLDKPAELSNASTAFTIPAEYGNRLVNYMLYKMFLKNQMSDLATQRFTLWNRDLDELESDWSDREYRAQNRTIRILE